MKVRSLREIPIESAPSEHTAQTRTSTPETLSPVAVSAPRQKQRSRKLAHALVDAISESIRSAAIRPGDKLPPESVIMAEHGVSRTVAREAITSLQAAGLIETRHGI